MAKTKRRQLAALAAQAELRELAALKERIAASEKGNAPGVYRLDKPQIEIRTQRVIFKIPALPSSKPVSSVPDNTQQKSTEPAVAAAVGDKTEKTAKRKRKQKERSVDVAVVAKRGKKRRQKEPTRALDSGGLDPVPADETKLSKGMLQLGKWKRKKRIADLLPSEPPRGTPPPSQQELSNAHDPAVHPPIPIKLVQQSNGEELTNDSVRESFIPEDPQNLPKEKNRGSILKKYKRKVKFTVGSSRKRKKRVQQVSFKPPAKGVIGLSTISQKEGQLSMENAARPPPTAEMDQIVMNHDRNGLEVADRMTCTELENPNSEPLSITINLQDENGAQEPKESCTGDRGVGSPPAHSLQTSTQKKRVGNGAKVASRRRIRVISSVLASRPRPRTRAEVSRIEARAAERAERAENSKDVIADQQTEGTGNNVAEDAEQVGNAVEGGKDAELPDLEPQEERQIGELLAKPAVRESERNKDDGDNLQDGKKRSGQTSETVGSIPMQESEDHQVVELQNGVGTLPEVNFEKKMGPPSQFYSGKDITIPRGADLIKQQRQVAIMKRRLEAAGGLTKWLLDKGLAQFLPLFEGRVNVYAFLLQLTMEGLKSMGFLPVGPRRKLIHAASTLVLSSIPHPIKSSS